ncbi:MAG: tryptophan/tyrosine permease, partial [Gammaproteobacteria bacterium]|nr:tryptophan/tyrosine permease [Gammaproteobacteria bacterium]
FGFSVIIPSLRTYFEDDVQLLKRTIFLGSLIPLVCYILWEAAIFSVTPLSGPNGLTSLASSAHPLAQLLVSLNAATHSPTIFYLSHLFTAICILTAFLCVALGLSDYVSDGIQKQKVGKHRWSIALMTFLPPLLCVIYFPRAFVLFLSLGGLFCVLLQALLPALMSWRTRYHQKRLTPYQVSGGMMGLILTILASLGVAIIAIFHP